MKFDIKALLPLCIISVGLSLSGCGIDGGNESSAEKAVQTALSYMTTVTAVPETTTEVPVSEPEISVTETAEWLTKNVWNETLSRIKLYTSSETDSGVIQIVPEKLMENLEKIMSERETYADAMESVKEAEPELYALWEKVDGELSAVYESIKGKELKGDGSEPVDVSGFAKSLFEFYEAAYSDGESHTDTGSSTGVTTVSESGTTASETTPDSQATTPTSEGGSSDSQSGSKPVATTAAKTSPTVTTPKSTSATTASTLYKKYSSERTMYVSSAVNVRSKPTADSERLGTLSAGSKITVIGESGNWYAFSFTDGKTAFLSKNYVSSSKPAATTTNSVQTTANSQAAATAATTTTACSATTAVTTTTKAADEAQQAENEVLRLVNIERAKEGVAPLTMDSSLCKAADIRVKEISESFSHTRPDGTTVFYLLYDKMGIEYESASENIAKGHATANDVMYLNEDYGKGWMYSDRHRGNILSSDFTKIGIAFDPDTNCWVQVFTG